MNNCRNDLSARNGEFVMADDRKLAAKPGRNRDVPADDDQLGENKHEAFDAAKDVAEAERKKTR